MNFNLLFVSAVVFLINLPFGYWRGSLKKKSLNWLIAIHAPVPMVVALRLLFGLGFRFSTFSVLVPAYFLGQFTGQQLNRFFDPRHN